jgi:Domain of unknown function (DUF4384)
MRRGIPLTLLALSALTLRAADPQRIQLTVERQDAASSAGTAVWGKVDSALVFAPGDRVRFRLSANFPGYLYVMNHGTTGAYELLFPRSDTGSNNRIEAAKEYIVPATQGWFRVDGPAGQDIIYWLVSPVELNHEYTPPPPPPARTSPLPSMRPRCDDSILKARGECIDSTAGVRPVKSDETLPGNFAGIAAVTPRDLLFIQEKGGMELSSESPLSGAVVYELRLAHR